MVAHLRGRRARTLVTLLALFIASGAAGAAHAAVSFKHIVIVLQENRTPDNLFGSNPTFEPGVDLATSGVNSKGKKIPLAAEPLDGCYDLDHSHAAFELSLDKGADRDKVQASKGCKVPPDPQFKYADNSTGTMQPYFDIATSYGWSNRMFQTNQGPSYPAHQFIFAGTSAPAVDSSLFAAENSASRAKKDHIEGCISVTGTTVPVINRFGIEKKNAAIYPCFEHAALTDLLDAASPQITWRYYAPSVSDILTAPNSIDHICQPAMVGGQLECTGPDWVNGDVQANDPSLVLTNISNCALPAVSWIIPTADESDHAASNKGEGPAWVASIVNAIGQQPKCASGETYWNDTAIIITWDDWGGWFDHVKPFEINKQPKSPAAWGDGYTYGFRVPLMIVSAYTPAGYVDNSIIDFGSLLLFIEGNFGLGYIGGNDHSTYGQFADYNARSRNTLGDFFSLASPRSFVAIPAKYDAKFFLAQPPSTIPPDDD